jgi:hypothetical protein
LTYIPSLSACLGIGMSRQVVRDGLRAGTNIPHVVTAGTFFTGDGKLFFDIHDPERSLAIDLVHDNYSRLIVEVDDDETPESAAERIRAAL